MKSLAGELKFHSPFVLKYLIIKLHQPNDFMETSNTSFFSLISPVTAVSA